MFRFGFTLGAILLSVSLLAVIILVSTFRGAEASSTDFQAMPIPVRAMTVRYQDTAEAQVRFPGLITARRESELGFESGGRLAEVNVDLGDTVQAGQVLARLDTRTLQARYQAAQAQYEAALAQAELASITLERQRILVDRGHISPQRLDEVEANAMSAQAQAEAARASADTLLVQLDLAELKAPYDGVITDRLQDEGSIAAPGATVLSIVERGSMELRVGLPVDEVAALEVGSRYSVEVNGSVMSVQLRAVTGVVDRQTRSVEAVFDLPAGTQAVAGTVGRIILPVPLDERGFWAPVTALTEGRRGLWNVYVVMSDETGEFVEPRPVEILHSEGDQVYLRGSVRDGESLLSSGQQRVTPNQRVAIAGL